MRSQRAFACVANVSEGARLEVVASIAEAAGSCVLDVHSDAHHNRSVITMASTDLDELSEAARSLTTAALDAIDLRTHRGVHPRFGAVDVVPFVPLPGFGDPLGPPDGKSMAVATSLRDRYAQWVGSELSLPCFCYGPGFRNGPARELPEVRREAFSTLLPDTGPASPHPTAGAVAAGARGILVAYNLWLAADDLSIARHIATEIRSPSVRALGFHVGGQTQVSCNLVAPWETGPEIVYDAVQAMASELGTTVERAELVGLVPEVLLKGIDRRRWEELGLSLDATFEAREPRAVN